MGFEGKLMLDTARIYGSGKSDIVMSNFIGEKHEITNHFSFIFLFYKIYPLEMEIDDNFIQREIMSVASCSCLIDFVVKDHTAT